MSTTDSPVEGSGHDTAMSVEDGAAAIAGLLSDVPEDTPQDSGTSEESQNVDLKSQSAGEEPEDGDEGLEFDEETSETEKDAPEEPEYKAGKFASRDAKVTLDDGTTISVADLIAGNMFQRTFTEKTTALSLEKKTLEAGRSQFAETKTLVEQQRNVILTLAQELMPQEPTPVDPNEDPAGYLSYLAERDVYQNKMNRLHFLMNSDKAEREQAARRQQEEHSKLTVEQQKAIEARREAEREKLYKAIPQFADEKARLAFAEDVKKIIPKAYGLEANDILLLENAGALMIVRDAIAYRKAIAKREAGNKPAPAQSTQPRIQPRQRMAPQTVQARDSSVAADRLRKTGSREDAAAALMQFVT